MSGTGRVPWVECYLYNFNNALEWLWIHGTLAKPREVRLPVAPDSIDLIQIDSRVNSSTHYNCKFKLTDPRVDL